MEVSREKSKIMTDSTSNISEVINMDGRKLEEVTSSSTWEQPSKANLLGTVEGWKRRGQQKKCCMGKIKEWASLPMPELLKMASRRKDWKRISAEASLKPVSYTHLTLPTTRMV